MDRVEGSLEKGIHLKKSNRLWFEPATNVALDIQVEDCVKKDPKFTPNVWEKVFLAMEQGDWSRADEEKSLVEQIQRDGIKERGGDGKYVSRFGFRNKFSKLSE